MHQTLDSVDANLDSMVITVSSLVPKTLMDQTVKNKRIVIGITPLNVTQVVENVYAKLEELELIAQSRALSISTDQTVLNSANVIIEVLDATDLMENVNVILDGLDTDVNYTAQQILSELTARKDVSVQRVLDAIQSPESARVHRDSKVLNVIYHVQKDHTDQDANYIVSVSMENAIPNPENVSVRKDSLEQIALPRVLKENMEILVNCHALDHAKMLIAPNKPASAFVRLERKECLVINHVKRTLLDTNANRLLHHPNVHQLTQRTESA